MTHKYLITFALIFLISKIASAQVGIKYDNQETTDYTGSMKSDDFTYLTWDRNHGGGGIFNAGIRPMFFYWDNDDNQFGYLIDTRNMNQLKASFHSIDLNENLTFNDNNAIVIDGLGNLKISNTNQGSFLLGGDPGISTFYSSSNHLEIGTKRTNTGVTDNILFTTTDGNSRKEWMRIKGNNGNVGIGITNPTHKLTVDGTISAKEVKVSTTPNSDYVFEPDYNLRPIEDVEAFVKQNKHLPGIPSAKEFKENGVGLGEMDDMLLRKVEELTLYVIEQNEKNNQLLKEIKKLKEENEVLKEVKAENEVLKARLREIENKLNIKK